MRHTTGIKLNNIQNSFDPISLFANNEVGVVYNCDTPFELPAWRYNVTPTDSNTSGTLTGITRTSYAAVSPIGNTAAARFTVTAKTNSVQFTANPIPNRQHCFSVYIKRHTGNDYVWIQNAGSVIYKQRITDEWQRIVISGTFASVVSNIQIRGQDISDAFDLWGIQDERDTLIPSPLQQIYTSSSADGFPPYTYTSSSNVNTFGSPSTSSGILLTLDQSKRLQLGSELITNGTFNTDLSGWAVGATSGAIWNDGKARIINSTGTEPGIWFGVNLGTSQNGKVFQISFDATLISGNGGLLFGAGFTAADKFQITRSENGGQTQRYTYVVPNVGIASPQNNFCINFRTNGTATWDIDNVSCKEVLGNHLFQTASSTGPLLSRRYNLIGNNSDTLTGTGSVATGGTSSTETLTNTNNTISDVNTSAISTATLLTEDTSTGEHSLVSRTANDFSLVANSTHRIQFYVQSTGRDWMAFELTGVANTRTFFNTTTGAVGTIGSAITSATIAAPQTTSVGVWWLVTLTLTTASTLSTNVKFYTSTADGSISHTGAITNILRITRVNITPQNTITYSLQAVSTNPTLGGNARCGHAFDGVDDWMQTNAIPFTTDKVTCFAVVLRQSDAANQIIFELGNASTSAFYLRIPTAASYEFQSAGSIAVQATTPTNYSSPKADVVTCIGDIGNDVCKVRVNGTEVASNTGNQGTGNYSNSLSLFVGRRNGSTLPFNGRLNYLVIINRICTNDEITQMEAFLKQSFFVP